MWLLRDGFRSSQLVAQLSDHTYSFGTLAGGLSDVTYLLWGSPIVPRWVSSKCYPVAGTPSCC